MNPDDILCELLRILSPKEIDNLTTTSSGIPKLSLTELLMNAIDGGPDDDSQLSKQGPVQIEERRDTPPVEVFTHGEHESAHQESERGFKNFFQVEEKVLEEKVNVTNFILSEKSKMRKSHERLKKIEVVDLYKKGSLVDIRQEKAKKERILKEQIEGASQDEESPSTTVGGGVLIDKKTG